jgi:hypothetical protein
MESKAKEPFNFRNHGSFDVIDIKELVRNFQEEWLVNTERQELYQTHKETNSYFLYKTSLEWHPDYNYSVAQVSDNSELLDLVEPIVARLEELHNGKRGQVLFIKLPANKTIPEHTDKGSYLNLCRRHHIPIITSKDTDFGVGDEELSMAEGECWEINNSRTHYVNNFSNVDRIHLLVDIMPNSHIR